jgi:hypothetical protein
MKRIYNTLVLFLLGSCSLLFAQAEMKLDKKKHDFGNLVWKNPATAVFSIHNTGNKPLVITQVTTSCGCTGVNWTQAPIMPGKTGSVSATFDAKSLGHFHKQIGIYTNLSDYPTYLIILGHVTYRQEDFSKTHPFKIGNLRLNKEYISFKPSTKGHILTAKLDIANESSENYSPVVMHLPSFLTMENKIDFLRPGENGSITLKLNTNKLYNYGVTETSIYLSRMPGDKVCNDNEILLQATLLPDFNTLSEYERQHPAQLQLSTEKIDITHISTHKRTKHTIILKNTGKSTLQISDIQVFHPAISVHLKHRSIEPGKSTKLTLKISGRKIKRSNSKSTLNIVLVCNDTVHPIQVIHLKK